MHKFSIIFSLLATVGLQAADLDLKSLGDAADGANAKRKYGPYVGISAGESLSQSGSVKSGDRKFSLNDTGGSAIFSIEVGKSWKFKRVPLQFSMDFESTFMQTSLEGQTKDANLPGAAKDAVAYNADMNSLFFNLNGTFALDLYRYRARIGKFAAGFRPYIGGGFGGGQVWYRNAQTQSRSEYQKTPGAVASEASLFTIDEFINSWNWYAGIEWTWKDQYSVFAEYRDFSVGDLDSLTGFNTDGYLVGFRYRY